MERLNPHCAKCGGGGSVCSRSIRRSGKSRAHGKAEEHRMMKTRQKSGTHKSRQPYGRRFANRLHTETPTVRPRKVSPCQQVFVHTSLAASLPPLLPPHRSVVS